MTRQSRLALTAVLAAGLALASVPASAGMLGKAALTAAIGYGLKKGAEACLDDPACRDRVVEAGTRLASRGARFCETQPGCAEGASRALGAIGGYVARSRDGVGADDGLGVYLAPGMR